jgi:hypothetical protein
MITRRLAAGGGRTGRLHTNAIRLSPPPHGRPLYCCPATQKPAAEQARAPMGGVMTGTDLITLAPWAVFGVGVAVVCVRLRRSRRIARRCSPKTGPLRRPPEQPLSDSGQNSVPPSASRPDRHRARS